MPGGIQVQSHHNRPVQSGDGQAYTRQGTGGGRYGGQVPFNTRCGVQPQSFFPGYSVRLRLPVL
jgi:hypothetical protein